MDSSRKISLFKKKSSKLVFGQGSYGHLNYAHLFRNFFTQQILQSIYLMTRFLD